MSDQTPRFRVIEGDRTPLEKARDPDRHEGVTAYACPRCSREIGFPFGSLIQTRNGACEHRGGLFGGSLWWSCARCFEPKFHIRDCD